MSRSDAPHQLTRDAENFVRGTRTPPSLLPAAGMRGPRVVADLRRRPL
jgi:hypothetical protein